MAAATVTLMACQRARARKSTDPWINPTLLGAAFDKGDVPAARKLLQEIRREGAAKFQLKTTIEDLEISLNLLQNPSAVSGLTAVLADLKALV